MENDNVGSERERYVVTRPTHGEDFDLMNQPKTFLYLFVEGLFGDFFGYQRNMFQRDAEAIKRDGEAAKRENERY
ncbi:MAG: hypothetical protein AABX23_05065 [Nanoarchaeota archaeon]